MATVDHTHGDVGEKPPQDLNFQSGDIPDPEVFDWFWSEVPAAINDHADEIEAIKSGETTIGSVSEADSATNVKGNDIDSDGDGKVNAADQADVADTADRYKGNDIDTDGDGKVDAAETADTAASATNVKGNDIDTDGDGKVDNADRADAADTADTVKGNDIDSDGDGVVDRADVADSASHDDLTNVRDNQHHEPYTDADAAAAAPVDSVNGKTGAVTIDTGDSGNVTTYKGNDIDSDGDGKVNAADTADTADSATTAAQVKGNDIDSDGDGKVDFADYADTADAIKGNDIDADGDGKVDAADSADVADSATTYKGNDIDSNGDGKVDNADQADQATNADTVDGEHASAFADTNHGNEEHNTNFTTLGEVNNNADVPNASYADTAGVADSADTADRYKGNDIDSNGDGKVDNAESADVADSANAYKGNDIDTDGDGKVDNADQADNADTVDGEHASAFADTNHGNEEHNTNFTTLGEVNNNADVPNADHADTADAVKGNDIDTDGDGKVNAADEADNADTVDGEHASAFADTNHGNEEHSAEYTTLSAVNNNADVPNADHADTASQADNAAKLGGSVASNFLTVDDLPRGIITMWSGSKTEIPDGWILCNGNKGTPDLRGRFVVGAGGQYSLDEEGGQEEVTLSESELPAHSHDYEQYDGADEFNTGGTVEDSNNLETYATQTTTETGGGQAHENRPPYYALAYIMKT
jgi:hypothetical protein